MRKSRKLCSLLTTAVLIGSLCASPFAEQTAQAASGKVTKVAVSNLPTKNLTLKKKKKFTLKVKVSTKGKISKAVSYKSSNKKVVTVSSKGKLKAKKNGKAKVTITSKANKKKKVTIKVTVGTPVTGIKLSETKTTLTVGAKKQLTATVAPEKASNKAIVWSSSNPKIATVSNGTVTAVANGTATITALAADGSGKKATAQITVGAAVTDIKLNTTAKTLLVGEATKLVATVTPTNAITKDVKWTSSNPALATVDAAGNVKAVKAGTAVITAQATDGSGKSASCKITVLNPVSLASLSYIGNHIIHFVLSEPTDLKTSDITIKTKKNGGGQYNLELKPREILSPDNKNFYIMLNDNFDLGYYVQVGIKGLRGNPNTSAEMQIKKLENTVVSYESDYYLTNEYTNNSISLYGCGYASYTVTGLPEGITYEESIEDEITCLNFRGTISKAGTYPVVIKYKDELGNAYEIHFTYTIYTENSVAAYTTDPFYSTDYSKCIYVLGKWNSSTTLTIVGEDYGLTAERSSSSHYFYLDGEFSEKQAGIYPIKVHIETTEDGHIYSCDYKTTIEVVNRPTLKGTVKNLSGDPILAQIRLIRLHGAPTGASYYDNYDSDFFTGHNGEYEISIPAGDYYIMVTDPLSNIYSNANYKLETSKTQDFTAQLYSINVNIPGNDFDDVPRFWQSEEGYVTYLNSTEDRHYLIVEPGQHTYVAYDEYSDYNRFKADQYVVTGNFSATTKSVNITKKEAAQIIGEPMTLDTPQCDVLFAYCNTLHAFTPTESGTYYFYSKATNDLDIYCYVYDKDGNKLHSEKYDSIDENTVHVVQLEKGKTYYLGASYFGETSLLFNPIFYMWDNLDHNSETFNIPLIISQKKPEAN